MAMVIRRYTIDRRLIASLMLASFSKTNGIKARITKGGTIWEQRDITRRDISSFKMVKCFMWKIKCKQIHTKKNSRDSNEIKTPIPSEMEPTEPTNLQK